MFDESERYSSRFSCPARPDVVTYNASMDACARAMLPSALWVQWVHFFFRSPVFFIKKLDSPSSNSIQKCDSEVCSAIHFAHLVPSCRGEVVSQWHWAMILPLFHRPNGWKATQFPSQSTPVCSSSIGSAIYFEFLNLVLSCYTLVFIESCQGYCLTRGTYMRFPTSSLRFRLQQRSGSAVAEMFDLVRCVTGMLFRMQD